MSPGPSTSSGVEYHWTPDVYRVASTVDDDHWTPDLYRVASTVDDGHWSTIGAVMQWVRGAVRWVSHRTLASSEGSCL